MAVYKSRTFRLPDDVWDQLTALAAIEGRTRTAQITSMIGDRLKKHPADQVKAQILAAERDRTGAH